VPVSEVSTRLKASEAHLSKVFQRMVRGGFVKSIRGPKGGFILAKPPEKIALLQVYETIEGPLSNSRCLLEAPVCRGKECIFGRLLTNVNSEVREHLAETKLSELTGLFKSKKKTA
jgi:Rrf2 family protein